MPKYKVLKSVAHNTGHSYVSGMNWFDGAFPIQHLRRAAREAGVDAVEVDLLSGEVEPARVLTREVRRTVESAQNTFEYLLRREGWSPEQMRSARLRLELPDRACLVEVVDDRGKVHVGNVVQWGA